jgi:glycosyltransferase involved in cell wall biosynthesis
MQFKDTKILIVTHQLYYGAAQALRDFLNLQKTKEIYFIGLPFYNQRLTYLEAYNSGKLKKIMKKKRYVQLGILDYCIDIVATIYYVLKRKQKYDYYVGAGTLDCFVGIILKKLGAVSHVIFYSIDFVPQRFANNYLNNIFHQLEIYCIKHSSAIWNVSPRIAEGRKKFLHISEKRYTQQVVPIGVWNDKVKKRKFTEIKKHQILFLGHLLEKQGVQLVIEALPAVIKKIPDLKFVIAGGGEYLQPLQDKVKDLSLEEHVIFTGWITKREKIDEMMSESAVAIATYKPEKAQLSNFTYYADPTKLKDYLSAGLPIILTDISYNAKEIAAKKCGVLVQYDKQEIAKALLKVLTDENKIKEYRRNALVYARDFDWRNIFSKVTFA